MLVKLNSETGGPVQVPFSPLAGQDPSTVAGKMILLVPGWNEIPQDDWKYVEANMEVGISNGKFELRCKEAEVEEETPEGKVTKIQRIQLSLAEVRADLARNIIKECFNPFTLERWAKDPKIPADMRNQADIALEEINKVEETR